MLLGNFFAVFVRGLTLSSKFVFLFVLAKFFAPEEVGLYGILVATIAYAIYPLGLEFYTYSTRQLDISDPAGMGRIIQNQLVLHLVLYILFLPALLLVFFFDFIPWELVVWFFLLVIVEHLGQEAIRLLLVMQKPVLTTFILFIRHGLWMLFMSVLMFYFDFFKSLKVVLTVWTVFGISSLLFSWLMIKRQVVFDWSIKVDFVWIKQGVKRALPFLMGALFFNFMFTADRYFFEFLVGPEALGAYVLYMALSASAVTFVETGVFSFIYPRLIEQRIRNDMDEFDRLFKRMVFLAVSFSLVLISLIWLVSYFGLFVYFFDNPVYYNYQGLLAVLLCMSFIQILSFIAHYGLYALEYDNVIVLANLFGLIGFLLTVTLGAEFFTVMLIPVALSVACCVILSIKGVAFALIRKNRLDIYSGA